MDEEELVVVVMVEEEEVVLDIGGDRIRGSACPGVVDRGFVVLLVVVVGEEKAERR